MKLPGEFDGLEWQQGTESVIQSGDWLQTKKNELIRTEKSGLFGGTKSNSAKFKAVTKALENLNDVMGMSVKQDEQVWQTSLRLVFKGYEVLLQACDEYLTNESGKMRSAYSSVGKKRIQMISEIKTSALSDMENLMVQRFENPDNLDSNRTVRDMLSAARTRKISLTKKDSEHEHSGGELSILTQLGAEETGGKDGFFKPEVSLYRDINKNCNAIVELAAEYSGISQEKLRQARAALGSFEGEWSMRFGAIKDKWIPKLKKNPLYQDPEIQSFCDRLEALAGGTDNSLNNMMMDSEMLNIQGDEINVSGRNVATSRMASLLGIGNMIAKSERVEMIEPGKQSGRVGNLMDKAEGTEAKKLIGQLFISEIGNSDKKYKDGDLGAMVAGKMTGAFQKDLSTLQVFDYICGQTDRHFRNYFIKTDENNMFTGLTGIDNDLSFGNAQLRDNGRYGLHGGQVVSESGDLLIPHMSREFAIAIVSLPEQTIQFALADLIEKPEIDACCKRLRLLKSALQKELGKGKDESRLRDTWGDDTLQDFLNEEGGRWGKGEKNYIGRLTNQYAYDYFYDEEKKLVEKMQKERGVV